MLAIALPVVAGLAGLAVDGGMLYSAHTRLQNAVDSAALAGSLQLPYDPDLTKNLVKGAAASMIATDYPGATLDSVTLGTEVRSACVKAKAGVDLTLMSALGVASDTVSATACAGYNNLEIVLVIDNTGSMAGAPIAAVKSSAIEMVNLVVPSGGAGSTKVGLVPFRGKVRIPSGVDGKAAGCRNADGSVNATNASSCSAIPYVKALTTDKSSIISAIGGMTANGTASGTVISEGIKWGTDVLVGPHYTQGGSKGKFRKVMILLTDGDNEDGKCGGQFAANYDPNDYWYNAYYGMGVQNCHCNDGGCLDQAMLTAASNAKAAGVEIFSIRYGDSDSNDVSLMKQVASSKPGTTDHYFDAPSTSDIGGIFKQIGKQLGLRLIN